MHIMVNLKKDIPISECIDDAVADRLAQINDLTNEVSALLKQKSNTETYVTREELASRFHCDVKKLPRQIPGFRMCKTVLYKQSDIDEFIKSRTKRK